LHRVMDEGAHIPGRGSALGDDKDQLEAELWRPGA